jgi:hypothetical protein
MQALECVSSYGDLTLSKVKFLVHGTSNSTEALSILDGGMRFTEGRPTFSTNIVHAHDWTVNTLKQAQSRGEGTVVGEPGSVILTAFPSNYYVGYGIYTSAFIDRHFKRVIGSPLRYAAGRKQLALYTTPETEKARLNLEAGAAQGYAPEQHPQYVIDTRFLIGSFAPGSGFDAVVSQLDVAARGSDSLELDRFQRSLRDIVRLTDAGNTDLVQTAIHDIVVGTVESTIISRLRMMRWQGLKLLGYTFFEGQNQIEIAAVKDIAEQRLRMDEMGRRLASSPLYSGEFAWLKMYVGHELELMRMELEGAELESLPD